MRLVTILGIQPRHAEYEFGSGRYRARLAPVAIATLRGDIQEVVALCTDEGLATTLPELRNALEHQGGTVLGRARSANGLYGRTRARRGGV